MVTEDEELLTPVSPRHSVRLGLDYAAFLRRAPGQDFVVRTITRREANGIPLMSAEIVIAGHATREQFPLAARYPLHFRKTYFPARLHGDPKDEFELQQRAAELLGLPPPIGWTPMSFRSCLVPGAAYSRHSPFGVEPEDRNLTIARETPPATAAGLWFFAEQAFHQLTRLHAAGIAHGDAELHNFIACPSPLETVPIDYEAALLQESLTEDAWAKRCHMDLVPLLKEAIYLQCCLGPQPGEFAERAWDALSGLFRSPQRFADAIGRQQTL